MSLIKDPDGNPLPSQSFSVYSEQTITFDVLIECRAGYELSGEAVGNVAVTGRADGIGGWTNLETSVIDLTPYAGTDHQFFIQVIAEEITARTTEQFRLQVAPA